MFGDLFFLLKLSSILALRSVIAVALLLGLTWVAIACFTGLLRRLRRSGDRW
jgi:N-acyl-L-homoserine lactone synthetase